MQMIKHTVEYVQAAVGCASVSLAKQKSVRAALAALLGTSIWSAPAGAQGIPGMLQGVSEAVTAGIDFVILLALFIGIAAILYGLKLIWDKSNDRADVKTGSIVMSLVGGALLCVIWLVVTVLVETAGGSAGDIGRAAQY